MSKTGFRAFAAGMILSTSVLAATYFLFEKEKKAEDVDVKREVGETDISSYLNKNDQIAVAKKEYDELVGYKETAIKLKAEQEKQPSDGSNQEKEEKPPSAKYKLTISDGMSTGDVSNILEQEGIINSASDLNAYLIEANYHTKIRSGSYELSRGMSFREIANVLTK
ncbi:endolytic transglycosylase MltG [Metabacillus arenae]|uniref:Endolytic transglycosylase MltG n=1 Tax=Metabacillus arenae TaxID=2771434 RepID=A0A926NF73_9BACI|nr:endolytic transglycosylase MltG [Metabacillus arenae]MBD1378893.1 endolytic transglycosylase MltG [Metabacillus arenae]